MAENLPDEELISVKEAARRLGGISTWQVYRLLEAQEIESAYIGKRRQVVLASLREYVANLPRTRSTEAS